MCSRFRDGMRRMLVVAATVLAATGSAGATLRVCADPDNLPYSRADASGFENRLAVILANDLHADLSYRWIAPRRGVVRKTLDADACDLLLGVPRDLPDVRSSAPYYRSGYAFVYRGDRLSRIHSLRDPRLASLRIGVQLIGADMAATPAAFALAARGITANVRGYPIDGDTPAAQRMIDDLAHDRLDVALVWGPQAGYFAMRAGVPLTLTLIDGDRESEPGMQFDISMAVRADDVALQRRLDEALVRLRPEIARVLDEYAVPRADVAPAVSP